MISIIDYGLGNVQAFNNSYARLGIPANVAKYAHELVDTTKIILPGVGSFDQAMQQLNSSGLRDSIEKLVLDKKVPILGICIGMQMLANSSEEGKLPGLGWINGNVKKFDVSKKSNPDIIPHMGWNNVVSERENVLFNGIENEMRFYFLHSYYFDPFNNSDVIGETDYGLKFASAINRNNIFGVQFHPEKSHRFGEQLLKNFSKI